MIVVILVIISIIIHMTTIIITSIWEYHETIPMIIVTMIWGYPKSLNIEGFLVLKPMVTWGSSIFRNPQIYPDIMAWESPIYSMVVYDHSTMGYHQPSRYCGWVWDDTNDNINESIINHHKTNHDSNTGWWFGTFFIFYILGIMIPTDFHIFQRGGSTTNQNSSSYYNI